MRSTRTVERTLFALLAVGGLALATACSPPPGTCANDANCEGGVGEGGAPSEAGGFDADETGPVLEAGNEASTEGGAEGGPSTGCSTEQCDGLDNDCDGMVDEDVCPCIPSTRQPCYAGPAALAGRGSCTYGMQTCVGDGEFGHWGACTGSGTPAAEEVCDNAVDENCNGVLDEGCECPVGMTRSCYSGPPGTMGVGLCRAGMQRCVMDSGRPRWSACEGQVIPSPNVCDGMDRACTGDPGRGCACILGSMPECYSGPAGTAGVGACRNGNRRCVLGADGLPMLTTTCMGEALPAAMETCGNRIDDNCNGMVDEGCVACTGSSVCYTGAAATRNQGRCREGNYRCVASPMGGGMYDTSMCIGQVLPAAMETCGNGIDDNCNGMVDEGCGTTCTGSSACYTGAAATRGRGRCRDGNYRCVTNPMGGTAFDTTMCVGQVLPAASEACGNGIDDNCNGMVDEGCVCTGPSECYTGPVGSLGRGLCRGGNYRCVANSMGGGSYDTTMCVGQVTPSTEVCGNDIDEDCDGIAQPCGCIESPVACTPWQIVRTPSATCFGRMYAACGFPGEFDVVPMDRVPPRDDSRWMSWPDPQINFGSAMSSPDRMSRLPATCNDRNGGDFTYFQTMFSLPENPLRPGFATATDFRIRVTRVNNAIRATLYNSRYPIGASFNALFESSDRCDMANISGDTRVNLADQLAPGLNRIVITHLDDAGPTRELTGVQLVVDGTVLRPCTCTTM